MRNLPCETCDNIGCGKHHDDCRKYKAHKLYNYITQERHRNEEQYRSSITMNNVAIKNVWKKAHASRKYEV